MKSLLHNVVCGLIPCCVRSLGVLLGVIMLTTTARAEVRPPAVAGSFYPGDVRELQSGLKEFLARAPGAAAPAALIAPHAGYVFSGHTAGQAFAPLAGFRATRVILLGPSHHVGFRGGALPSSHVTAFATPLGEVPVDTAAVAKLAAFPEFDGPSRAHDPEHSLEVELPFLQATVGAVPIVPILVGQGTDRALARAMAKRLAGLLDPGTVVVVSSDFTHHGAPYDYAPFPRNAELPDRLTALARATAGRAAAIDPRGFWDQVEVSGDTVCGVRPIAVLLELLAHAFHGTGSIAEVTTSAAVSHDLHQVVAYAGVDFVGSWTPWQDDPPEPRLGTLSAAEQKAALELARAALATHLTHDGQLANWFANHRVSGNLAAPAGVFVTINNRPEKAKKEGRLRGCIGMMEARVPLAEAIVDAAVSASHDPRFADLKASELGEEDLEISVLSPTHRVAGPEAIELGKDGVLLSKGGYHAVFLPQVATETGWDLPTFLSQLSLKAGLAPDAWRHGADFEVFTAQVFHEQE
jgi:AmmeMemoRadiSam system protein B/AmmeMemoRadiSam system protein A